MPPRFTRKLLHPVCLVGGIILATGIAASVLGPATELGDRESSAYEGLLIFVLFPSVSAFGLLLVTLGLWLEHRRARKLAREQVEWTPRLDPARGRHRVILCSMAVFGLLFFVASMISAYHAYEFTETTVFCGKTCHTPMEPQHTAHQFSPHASLACTDCHVGEGIQGFVEAKLSGVRQLFEMVGSRYPRPIIAAHDKVLIAAESCQRCHRPDKWWGPQLDSRTRYGYDLRNSMRTLSLLMKPGNVKALPSPGKGVHWHMSFNNIWFRAADERRQTIPWVKVERADGTMIVFEDKEWKDGAAGTELLEEQLMQCVDCHSRPAHRFLTPDVTVNSALTAGVIDSSLPSIKKVAVAALAMDYDSPEEARAGIRSHIEKFYGANFGGTVLERKETLERAIEETGLIYQRNAFPGMKVKWSTHPDNTGHRESPGCLRCHGGKHVSADGAVVASECDACHVFFEKARDSESLMEIPADGSTLHSFRNEAHYKNGCWSCHAGTSSPYSKCESCHATAVGGHAMQFECSICHKPGEPETSSVSCGPCHPAGESTLHVHKDHGGNCLSCHRQHAWAVAAESCGASGCHEDKGPNYLQENLQGFAGVGTLMSGLPVGGR